jgi:hypothetical protein
MEAPHSTAFPGHAGPSTPTRPRSKQAVAEAFLQRLHERGDIDLSIAGFVEGVCAHFERLPTRYALDVNIDSLDVLSHKRLLEEARSDPATVSFAVRSVEVLHARPVESADGLPGPAFPGEVRAGNRVAALHAAGGRLICTSVCARTHSREALACGISASVMHMRVRCICSIVPPSSGRRSSTCVCPPPRTAAIPSARAPSAPVIAAAIPAQAGVWVVSKPPGAGSFAVAQLDAVGLAEWRKRRKRGQAAEATAAGRVGRRKHARSGC